MWQVFQEQYQRAQREARRFQAEHPQEAALPVLEEILPADITELPLGLLEVPLAKIRGTFAAGRAPAFAGNFLPLLSFTSEFGQKWIGLCRAHLTEGLREPIKAYEYLGYYYVVEGHKRVSVLRHFGAYSFHADVTRLLPPPDPENEENTVFYELLGENRRAVIGNMWFSRAGVYPKLLAKAAAFAEGRTLAKDWLAHCFSAFRQAYHMLEYPRWPLTTGDAFALYVDVYGFPLEEPATVTAGRLRTLSSLLRHRAGLPAAERKTAPPPASGLVVAFAFEGMPGTSEICRVHNAGRLALQRARPEITIKTRFGLPPGDDAIPDFEALAAEKPHLLFAPSPGHERAALRAMLTSRDMVVLHQNDTPGDGLLPTYHGHLCPAAFLAGILAGALTDTDVVGFGLPGYHEAHSFAHGARLVNPRAHTMVPKTAFSSADGVVKKLCREGADIAVLPHVPDGAPSDMPGQPKGFLGGYAWLCKLDRRLGCPALYWGMLGTRWDLFYLRVVQRFLAGEAIWSRAGQAPLTLSMGMPLADFFPIAVRMPAYSLRLLALMRQCLDRDEELAAFPDGQKPFFITVT